MAALIDQCLSARADTLYIEGCSAGELAARFGTPLHVVSEDQLRRNARRIAAAFEAAWPHGPVRLLPAIKANLTLALRHVLNEEGTGCDAFGGGELEAALRAGTPPALISLNGPAKDDGTLRLAIAAGVRITVDSLDELQRVAALADAAGSRAAVRVRLRPHLPGATGPTDLAAEPLAIADAILAYKPGLPADDIAAAGALLATSPALDARGVHMHMPRHAAEPALWRAAMEAFAALIAELSAAAGGWVPLEIDVGGGFPSPRDPTGRALLRRAGADAAPPIESFAEAVGGELAAALAGAGIEPRGIVLEVEPGRSLYGDAGVHLTRVRHVKRQRTPRPYTWIETDTSEAFLPDGLLEHNGWTVLAAERMQDAPGPRADVVGCSCGFDVLAPAASLPAVEVDDVLAIPDTGAYQDAASSTFNALPRPATVLVHGDTAEVVKRRETLADLFARDVVPARLGRGGATARLDHAGVTVGNLERSLGFYRDLIGLRVRAIGEDDALALAELTGVAGARLRWADLDAGGGRVVELLEYLHPEAPPAPAAPNAPGSAHVALAVADLDGVHERLRAAGVRVRSTRPVTLEDAGEWSGVTCLYAADPDGLTVELLERPA
jgi:diaminopimelate decarboxylase